MKDLKRCPCGEIPVEDGEVEEFQFSDERQ